MITAFTHNECNCGVFEFIRGLHLSTVCVAVSAEASREHRQCFQSSRDHRTERCCTLCCHQGVFVVSVLFHFVISWRESCVMRFHFHKGAIVSMTKAMAVDESRYNVRVNWWVKLVSGFFIIYYPFFASIYDRTYKRRVNTKNTAMLSPFAIKRLRCLLFLGIILIVPLVFNNTLSCVTASLQVMWWHLCGKNWQDRHQMLQQP